MSWDSLRRGNSRQIHRRLDAAAVEDAYDRRSARTRDENLQDDAARLALVTEAMWSLLSERLGLTDDDLRARIAELDAADGTVDGQRRDTPRPCGTCEAKVPADRDTCQFCGAPAPGASIFR